MGPRIREDTGGGVGSRPCLHGVRLCAGIHEGMGPRIREDTVGKDFTVILVFTPQGGRKKRGDGSPHPRGPGFPSLSSRGQALRRHSRGDGSPHPRGHEEGKDFTPILAFPPQGGRKKRGDGSPHPRGHEGGERLHPHPSLPPSRGKEKETGGCMRDTGGG